MSKWDSPATSTVNALHTTCFTLAEREYYTRMLSRKVTRTKIQHNGRQLADYPIREPHPWMWYYYEYRTTAATSVCSYQGYLGGVDRFRPRLDYGTTLCGMGRNLMQAKRDYYRKLALASKGMSTR